MIRMAGNTVMIMEVIIIKATDLCIECLSHLFSLLRIAQIVAGLHGSGLLLSSLVHACTDSPFAYSGELKVLHSDDRHHPFIT